MFLQLSISKTKRHRKASLNVSVVKGFPKWPICSQRSVCSIPKNHDDCSLQLGYHILHKLCKGGAELLTKRPVHLLVPIKGGWQCVACHLIWPMTQNTDEPDRHLNAPATTWSAICFKVKSKVQWSGSPSSNSENRPFFAFGFHCLSLLLLLRILTN